MGLETFGAGSFLIRTDFSDDAAWDGLCKAACAPSSGEGFVADLVCVDAKELDGATVESLCTLVPGDFFFIADAATISDPEHPILVVNNTDIASADAQGGTFRVIPSEMHAPENNLGLGNMDFEEFTDATDSDGVFRGFR